MKKKNIIIFYASVFVLMFVLRFIYGYAKYSDSSYTVFSDNDAVMESVRNYASDKIKVEKEGLPQGSPASIDQKYEKIANVNSVSSKFEQDEKKIRDSIKNYNAVIQLEQKNGNPGKRELNLIIGVQPDKFETLYDEILKIGNITFRKITKTDKTNDFLKLNAAQTSLEKMRSSLLELKNRNGNIDEFIKLQNRILEVEKELQTLGVQLGSYDNLNEFCTVKFTLKESGKKDISFIQRIVVSLGWTIKYYFVFVISTFFVLFSAGTLIYINGRINFKRFFRK
ncbi:MAG TPA: DUF4349 domain-containing protein [Spirochaetota bacterium]|nr:DUF4349 domain-containing protein [Spirochaetota bacterium]HOU85981.1 DUF4349 domain-containing protein [Spirochaetota bacterium]HPK57709.1 DUF4349 domain-containing protein [Spirochaetota bacterium]HQE57904.1 DUF4349 domain-containing protein [Spirochaetota bacterium]